LKIPTKLSPHYKENSSNFQAETLNELIEIKYQKRKTQFLKLLVAVAILASGVYKFISYWAIFGKSIFIIGVGRFIIISIILSILIHVLCTKTVIYHILFSKGLKKQIKDFEAHGAHKIGNNEMNKFAELNYLVPYNPVVVGNQKIWQKADPSSSGEQTNNLTLSNNTTQRFRTNQIIGNEGVYIIYTGILLDSEINNLYSQQNNSIEKKAVAAACKEIQISAN